MKGNNQEIVPAAEVKKGKGRKIHAQNTDFLSIQSRLLLVNEVTSSLNLNSRRRVTSVQRNSSNKMVSSTYLLIFRQCD